MYGYGQGTPYGNFNSTYTTSPAAAAAAVVNAYSTPAATAQQQQPNVFGYTGPSLSSSFDCSAASAASVAAANPYAYAAYGYGGNNSQAAVAQHYAASRLAGDAYANAASASAVASPFSFSAPNTSYAGYSSRPHTNQTQSGLGGLGANNNQRAAAANSYQNKYDAAVYAVAQSYLQKQHTGGGFKKNAFSGMGGGSAGGNKTFPSTGQKRFGVGASTHTHREPQQFYCEVCKISCAGQLTYKEHLEGQRHKKKEALAKGEGGIALPKSKVSFRCDLCNVTCTGKDTYEAHVRGSKHQKTVALCKKLGKPIPANEPTIIAPKDMGGTIPPLPGGTPIPTVGAGGNSSISVKKTIPQMHFVAGAKLSSTPAAMATSIPEINAKKALVAATVGSAGTVEEAGLAAATAKAAESNPSLEALLAAEQNVKPVGEEYVVTEKDANGKHLTYNCKLCDCKFSDINAKEIHLKGRRHRLQYKQKVDPTLQVEMKSNERGKKNNKVVKTRPITGIPMAMMMGRPMMGGGMGRGWLGPDGMPPRYAESSDDRHIMLKQSTIYPDEEEMADIEKAVQAVEKALKGVSDQLEDKRPKPAEGECGEPPERLLKGAMRIGALSKGLVLKGEQQVELVALLSELPTVRLLKEIGEKSVALLKEEGGSLVEAAEESALLFSLPDIACRVKITLTSPAYRAEETEKARERPGDVLPEGKCLEALAELRHAKWFQVRCATLPSCQVTLRILRDIRSRIETWASLSEWMTELLVEKVLASVGVPLGVGDALRRFFEAIASGILFDCGPGLADPCEKQPIDVLACLGAQQREDMTCSGQHALRLIAFNQIHKILMVDRLAESPRSTDRKRPRESNGSGQDDAKKDKLEGAEEEEEATPTAVDPSTGKPLKMEP